LFALNLILYFSGELRMTTIDLKVMHYMATSRSCSYYVSFM